MRALFLSILDMTTVGSAVILVVLLARLCLYRAPRKFSYLLWGVVAFRLCCPFSFRAAFSLFSLRPEQTATVPKLITAPSTATPTFVTPPTTSIPVPTPIFTQSISEPLPIVGTPTTAATNTGVPWLTIASVVWLIGAAAMIVWGCVGYLRKMRQMRTAILLFDNVLASEHVRSPFILGIFRPKIYLPFHLDCSTRRCVLAHEQYHLRQHDHLVMLLAFSLLALHWFNPLCWIAFFLMSRDMEMRCDEAMLAANGINRKTYAQALLTISANRRFLWPTTPAFGTSAVERRIRRVLRWKYPRTGMTAAALLLSAVVFAACAADPLLADTVPPTPQSTATSTTLPATVHEPMSLGNYQSILHYAQEQVAQVKTVEYLHLLDTIETAAVIDTKVTGIEKLAELETFADGTLELWTVQPLLKLDVNPYVIRTESGLKECDGWHAPDNGIDRRIVALPLSDGTYRILSDALADPAEFPGNYPSYEEALHDWYITVCGVDAPRIMIDLSYDHGQTSVPARRVDGDGWYLYFPADSNWSQPHDTALRWVSDQFLGSSVEIRRLVYDDPQWSQAMRDCADGNLNPSRHADGNTWDYYFPASETVCWQVRITQQPTITVGAVRQKQQALLHKIAESFTVTAPTTAICADDVGESLLKAMMHEIENGAAADLLLTRSELPVTALEDRNAAAIHRYSNDWSLPNSVSYFLAIAQNSYTTIQATPIPQTPGNDAVMLIADSGWSLIAFDTIDEVCLHGPLGRYWLQPGENAWISPYEALRSWYDAHEEAAVARSGVLLGSDLNAQQAAQAYADAFGYVGLSVSTGSYARLSHSKSIVEMNAEATAHARAEGQIGANSECFTLTWVFVPENERSELWHCAGNTMRYRGELAPEGSNAYVIYRSGYVTHTADGWDVTITG